MYILTLLSVWAVAWLLGRTIDYTVTWALEVTELDLTGEENRTLRALLAKGTK